MLPAEAGAGEDPFVGKVIGGKYRIVKQLGEGGMGAVYMGEQQMGTTVRKVAVKTLHKHLSQDQQIKDRFQREVSTVVQLEHPNTIQVFDFGTTDDGTLYIVMELVQGKSVQDLLEKEGPMPPARVENIMRQVTGSLEEAHGLGIIHRDLKPDNVVLCERAGQKDWVEVLDFGIAKRSNETDEKEKKLTQQGMVLGTPPYMSPEQFTGQPLDARSDIYSLGVMMYEMLTGQLPFEANTAWEWATQHMTAQPKAFEATPNGALLPPRMRAAIMKALSKAKEDRPASVRELYDSYAGGEPAPVSAMPQPPSTGPGVRAKTEVGTPVFMGGPPSGGPASPYGPPPASPPMGGPSPSGGGYGASPSGGAYGAGPAAGSYAAPIPAGPVRDAGGGGGGGRGALIGIAAVVALATIGGVAFAVSRSGARKPVPVVDTTVTSTTTEPTAPSTDPSSATADPDPSGATPLGAKPLGNTGNTGPAYTGPVHVTPKDAGAHTPTGPVTPPAAKPDAATIAACAEVADRKKNGKPVNPTANQKCTAGGGKLP
jgi:serine/threonine-protein kinase